MGKIISFMHISLDGFVAGPNGEMNWIKVDQEVFDHIGNRIKQTDTALYGRSTYEMMEGYWPTAGDAPNASKHDIEHAAWYKRAHKVVLSSLLAGAGLANTTVISENIPDRINELRQRPGGEILLFGSPTAAHALMEQNLVDGYWLFVNPIILGDGIPLFAGTRDQTKLKLQATRSFSCGVTELSYTADRS